MNKKRKIIAILLLILYLFAFCYVNFEQHTSHCTEPKGTCQLCLVVQELRVAISQSFLGHGVLGFVYLFFILSKLSDFIVIYLKSQTLVSLRVRLDN